MMKRTMSALLVLLSGVSLLVVACGQIGGTPTSPTDSGGGNDEVHLNTTTFALSSVTIQKGSSSILIDDIPVPHIIQNGTWANGAAQPHQEAGAPTVNAHFTGNDRQVIGPFPVAGTYHLYCAVHQGMNLTVVVQD